MNGNLEKLLDKIWQERSSASKFETQHLDFKTEKETAKATFHDLAEAAVCFANAEGGTIVLGVRDQTLGPDAFVGTSIDAGALQRMIYELTNPKLTVSVMPITYGEKALLVVQVPEGLDVYATGKGYSPRRWEDQCQPMHPSDVTRLGEERRGIDWSAQASGRSFEDLDVRGRDVIDTDRDQ